MCVVATCAAAISLTIRSNHSMRLGASGFRFITIGDSGTASRGKSKKKSGKPKHPFVRVCGPVLLAAQFTRGGNWSRLRPSVRARHSPTSELALTTSAHTGGCGFRVAAKRFRVTCATTNTPTTPTRCVAETEAPVRRSEVVLTLLCLCAVGEAHDLWLLLQATTIPCNEPVLALSHTPER